MTVTELEQWHDHDLEDAGRLVAPMRYVAITDRHVEVKWERCSLIVVRLCHRHDRSSVIADVPPQNARALARFHVETGRTR
jgi:formate dehydrogenase major subunit